MPRGSFISEVWCPQWPVPHHLLSCSLPCRAPTSIPAQTDKWQNTSPPGRYMLSQSLQAEGSDASFSLRQQSRLPTVCVATRRTQWKDITHPGWFPLTDRLTAEGNLGQTESTSSSATAVSALVPQTSYSLGVETCFMWKLVFQTSLV